MELDPFRRPRLVSFTARSQFGPFGMDLYRPSDFGQPGWFLQVGSDESGQKLWVALFVSNVWKSFDRIRSITQLYSIVYHRWRNWGQRTQGTLFKIDFHTLGNQFDKFFQIAISLEKKSSNCNIHKLNNSNSSQFDVLFSHFI